MQNPLDTLRQNSESGDKRAVSPVIGVILMVAITVILAAVIATFVLGIGDQVDSGVNTGVTVDQNNDTSTITITYTGGGNADGVATIGTGNNSAADNIDNVGESITLNISHSNVTLSEGDTFSVIAYSGGSASANTTTTALEDEAGQTTVIRTVTVEIGG